MKINKQVTALTEQLRGELHLDRWDDLIRRATPSGDTDAIRRHVDAIRSALAKAGRLHYLPLSITLALVAVALLVSGLFFPTLVMFSIVAGAMSFAGAMFVLFLVDPRPAVLHVESFTRNSAESIKQWERDVRQIVGGMCDQSTNILNAFVSRSLTSEVPMTVILTAINEGEEYVQQMMTKSREQLKKLNEEIQQTERRYDGSIAKLRAAKARSSSRVLPAKIRRAARNVVGEREHFVTLNRERIIIETVLNDLLMVISGVMSSLISGCERDIVNPLNVLQQQKSRIIDEYSAMRGRDLYGKMLPSDRTIAEETSKLLDGAKGNVFGVVSRHASGDDVVPALNQYLESILEQSSAVPASIAECIRGLNGNYLSFLTQLEAESTELAISKATPGREQRRFRTVMTHGSINSPVYRSIAERSEGCVTRALDYDRQDEVVVITEERFQPGSELLDLVEAVRVLKSLPRAKQAAMVVAVDDDDIVLTQCNPEQRMNAQQDLRQLCLGLIFDGITRSGNYYKLSRNVLQRNPELSECASIGQGFDVAANTLQTDERFAHAMDSWLKSELDSRGSEETADLIRSAIEKPGLVPANHEERVRALMADELNRTSTLVG